MFQTFNHTALSQSFERTSFRSAFASTVGVALTATALVSLTGCATIRSTTGINAPEPMSTTATGAVTGAAVGGGLGLLVGSTSGNAGEGLLVGSLAGTALGAGIGAKLDRDEKTADVNSARSKVVEQNDLIDRQNEHLNRMRGHTGSDNETLFDSSQLGEEVGVPRHAPSGARNFAPKSSAPRAGRSTSSIGEQDVISQAPPAARTVSDSTRRGQLRTPARTADASGLQYLNRPSGLKKATPYGSAAAAGQSDVHLSQTALKATGSTKTIGSESRSSTARQDTRALVEPKAAAEPKKVAKSQTPPATLDTDSTAKHKNPSALPPAAINGDGQGSAADSKAAKSTTPKEVAPKDQADCKEAVKEAERGLHATADADRLFYLRRAARLCPSEASYHVELGKLYSGLGKNDDAKYEFRQAIDLDSNNQVARDELSIVENAGNISR